MLDKLFNISHTNMASLDLKIEFEDKEAPDKQEASSIGGGLMRSLRQSWKSKADSSANTPGTIDNTSAALANILRNFLQPGSALSLHEASESILKLIPANASHSTEVRVFGDYCIELADRIPYHHPSHLKLAHLLSKALEPLFQVYGQESQASMFLSLYLARHRLYISFV